MSLQLIHVAMCFKNFYCCEVLVFLALSHEHICFCLNTYLFASFMDHLVWSWLFINQIRNWLFWGSSRIGGGGGGGKKPSPIPKICHSYPTLMKLGTVITYPKKIQKTYESRDTLLEFCWHQHFFNGNQQILLCQEIQV